MKKNNQGFMLVEALVMSTVIIGVLIFMFIQFRNISRGYDKSFSYNSVPSLYYTNELKEYLASDLTGHLLDLDDYFANEDADYLFVVKYLEDKDEYLYFAEYNEETNEYEELGIDYEEFEDFVSYLGIKTAVVADEELTGLRGIYHKEFSEGLNDYINYVKTNGDSNRYRLVVEFLDDTYASLSLGGDLNEE